MKLFLLLLCFLLSLLSNSQRTDSSVISAIGKAKPFLRFGKRSYGLVLSLETLHVQDEVFWFRFLIRNRSALSYPVDLFRLYLRDKTHGVRSSQQELELTPLYSDSLSMVPAHSIVRFCIALPKFTIADNKICALELFEFNGGRNLFLAITNRQLFLARPITQPDNKKNK